MYLKFDLATPVISEWASTIAFKRKIMRTWPTESINGVEVFSDVEIWTKWAGVVHWPELYKVLRVTEEEIGDNDFDGLEIVTFELKPWGSDSMTFLSSSELAAAIDSHIPTEVIHSAVVHYETTNTSDQWTVDENKQVIPDTVTDEELIALIRGGLTTIPDESMAIDDQVAGGHSHPFLFAVLADNTEVVFNRTFKILSRTAADQSALEKARGEEEGAVAVKTSITMEITYVRKASASSNLSAPMFAAIEAKVALIRDYQLSLSWDESAAETSSYMTGQKPPIDGFIARQLLAIDSVVNPPEENAELFYNATPPSLVNNTYNSGASYIRVSGAEAMTGREFVEFFGKAFKTGYTKEDVSLFIRIVNVLIIIVAIFFAIPTGGGSLFALASTAAVAIGIGVAVQYAFGKFLEYTGNLAGAMFTFKMMTILSNISKVVGFIAFIGGIAVVAVQGFAAIAVNTTLQVVNTVGGWINQGFDYYKELTTGDYSKELADKKAEVEKQEKILEDYTSPKAMELIQYHFENYEWAEVNAQLEESYYFLTQHKVDIATAKYY